MSFSLLSFQGPTQSWTTETIQPRFAEDVLKERTLMLALGGPGTDRQSIYQGKAIQGEERHEQRHRGRKGQRGSE